MRRILMALTAAAAILVLTALPVMAQTAPPAPPASAAPGPTDQPSAMTPSPPEEKLIDGPVKQVDPVAKTVKVGWFLGLLSTTLEVTDDTQIAVGGMKASLQDIQEGARVKAAYEARDGKYVAKSIETEQAEVTGSGTPGRSPASQTSPMQESPSRYTAPPAGEPKTP